MLNFRSKFLTIITIIILCIITTQSKYNSIHRANLRPNNKLDNVERNTEKLVIVFNKTCVNSVYNLEQKIQDLLQEYKCLSKWKGIYNHHKFPNVSGVFDDANGNYRVYFTFNENQQNETSCIDTIYVNYQEYCIEMIDYEMKLKAIGCLSSTVYGYSPSPSYYRWHLDKIDGVVDNSYKHIDTSNADGNVDIYILDSGILETHYEFSQVKSYTLMDSSYPDPETGHGTHVAGITVGRTCGITNHNIFDYPVCRGSTEACYSSYIEDAFSAILTRLSSTKRRGVINMSFGTSSTPSSYDMQWYDSYLSQLINAGAIPVAAAGNDAQDACSSYPAASPYAFGIGSHDSHYNASSFSNYGSCVDIYAPGDGILSSWYTDSGAYAIASGTSMATPVMTGIIADLLWNNNTLTFNKIKSILQQPSNNINVQSCLSGTNTCKAIKINCAAIYNSTANPTTTTAKPTTTTAMPTTAKPTTTAPTTLKPTTTATPTTLKPTTTATPTTSKPTTTTTPTTLKPTTTATPTTLKPTTTATPTTSKPTTTTTLPTTLKPTTLKPTTSTSKPTTTTTSCKLGGNSCTSGLQCCSSICLLGSCF